MLEVFEVPNVVRKARHEFHKSPPCKAGFCSLGYLLGCFPPKLDQFQKRLAAVSHAMTLLERVDQLPRLCRQLEQNLLHASRANALAVSADMFGSDFLAGFSHGANLGGQFLESLTLKPNKAGVYDSTSENGRCNLKSFNFLEKFGCGSFHERT
jgi:hypothetical protein